MTTDILSLYDPHFVTADSPRDPEPTSRWQDDGDASGRIVISGAPTRDADSAEVTRDTATRDSGPAASKYDTTGTSTRDGDIQPPSTVRSQCKMQLFDDDDDGDYPDVLARSSRRRTSGYGSGFDGRSARSRRDDDHTVSLDRRHRSRASRDGKAGPVDGDGRNVDGDDDVSYPQHPPSSRRRGSGTAGDGRRSPSPPSPKDDRYLTDYDSSDRDGRARARRSTSPAYTSTGRLHRARLQSAVTVPAQPDRLASLPSDDNYAADADNDDRVFNRRRRSPQRHGSKRHQSRDKHKSSTRTGSRRRYHAHRRKSAVALGPCNPDSSSDEGSVSGQRAYPHRIRLRPFDGSGSFETFLSHFDNCSSYNKWSERDKIAHLKAALVSEAGQVLWDSDP